MQDSTKFADLPDEAKRRLVTLEELLRKQEALRDKIREHLKGQAGEKEVLDVETLRQRLAMLSSELEREVSGVQSLREHVRKELKFAEEAARQAQADPRNPRVPYALQSSTQLPSRYDWYKIGEFQERMQQLRAQVDDLDRHVASLMQDASRPSQRSVQDVLRSQHEAVIAVAARVSRLHAQADALRDHFRSFRLRYFDDAKDPFRDKAEKKPADKVPEPPPLAAQQGRGQDYGAWGSQTEQPQYSLAGGSVQAGSSSAWGGGGGGGDGGWGGGWGGGGGGGGGGDWWGGGGGAGTGAAAAAGTSGSAAGGGGSGGGGWGSSWGGAAAGGGGGDGGWGASWGGGGGGGAAGGNSGKKGQGQGQGQGRRGDVGTAPVPLQRQSNARS
jgi:uncharacterized small protein (DUF1192 family)